MASKSDRFLCSLCNSDSETLAALQKVETVVRTQQHCLDADKFPMFWDG